MLQKQTAFKFSTFLAGFIVLLSAFAFSGATVSHTDNRTPFANEAITNGNRSNARNLSFQHATQVSRTANFLLTNTIENFVWAIDYTNRISFINTRNDSPQKFRSEILDSINLHAPRSSMLIPVLG